MSLNKKIVDITRELRRLQTPEEKELWEKLRNPKFNGLKFLRQHPIVYAYKDYTPLFFVADFYCAEKKLVIELDGKIHEFQKDYDENRDSILKELGLRVLRIKNAELSNLETVLQKIIEFSTHPPPPSLQSREGVIEQSEIGGELTILILAAGPSTRMGQSKQQLLIDGKSLLIRTVETALQSDAGEVIVVLGASEDAHRQLLKEVPIEIIFNPEWEAGMGSSLKAGLSHALSINPRTEAIIVMVCDQPQLRSYHVKSLLEKHKSTKALIVASSYASTIGVPALFDKKLFGKILELDDEHGAKKIIQQYQAETIDFPEGVIDLDTPEEYGNFISSKKNALKRAF